MRAGLLALLLCGTAALAQTAAESESHIASAFTSGADPGVFAARVRVGPTLRGVLGGEADGRKVYNALFERVSGRFLQLRSLPAAEASRHAALVGGTSGPLIVLEAGELALLFQYAPRDRHVTFVEQLRPQPLAKPAPPKPAVVMPQLAPAPPKPPVVLEVPLPPKPVEKPKPVLLECVIKPVMTDEELRACGAR